MSEPVQVSGRKLANSFSYFEQRCLEAIAVVEPLGCAAPVGVHAVLCDAVRLARECQDFAGEAAPVLRTASSTLKQFVDNPWQSMDVAPKDGTPILVQTNREDHPYGAKWAELDNSGWRSFPGFYPVKPLKWMPLPEK